MQQDHLQSDVLIVPQTGGSRKSLVGAAGRRRRDTVVGKQLGKPG